jgi:hypothetical protein
MVSRNMTRITMTIDANMNGGRFMVPISKSAHVVRHLACHEGHVFREPRRGAEREMHVGYGG